MAGGFWSNLNQAVKNVKGLDTGHRRSHINSEI